MSTTVTPFLMFTGDAGAASALYVATLPDSSVERMDLHGPEAGEQAGQVLHGVIVLAGQRVRLYDSPPVHDFSFTPSTSLFVELASVAEVDRVFEALSLDGQTLMPLDTYPFAERFGWCNDRYGVSWQISVAP